jgi:hypothetical protein
MSSVSSRILCWVALALSAIALLPSKDLRAQDALVAKACVSARPLARSGADSGKFLVLVMISGIPEIGLRSLGQMVLADPTGRTYAPYGYSIETNESASRSLLAAYPTPPAQPRSERQYLFLVAPGLMAFELRIPGLKPTSVAPSLATESLRNCVRTA